MKFFVDNNLSPRLLPTLTALLPDHEFTCALHEGLTAVNDILLFSELAQRGFNALITRDRNQLADTEERRALVDSGLH